MLRCTNCNAEVEDEPGARCPSCLRRSTVVGGARPSADPLPRTQRADAWPTGTTCPLCRVRTVSLATFIFTIAKSKIAMTPGQNEHRWVHVRCRCCDACRARVVRLESLRKIAVGCLVALLLAVFALTQLVTGAVVVVAGAALAFASAVVVVAVGNRALRTNLEGTPLFENARVRLVGPGGLVTQERWSVRAEVPPRSTIVDAAELV